MYYIKTKDNCKLAIEEINPSFQKTIVLVHGWPLSKEMFEYQKEALNHAGYRIVSYDIRGFGNSEVTGKGYDYETLAKDLYEVIESLEVESIILLGFSMGGAICTRYMAQYNNHKVSKLILAGAAAPSYGKDEENPYGISKEDTDILITNLYKDRPSTVRNFGKQVFALNHSRSFQEWFHSICLKASGIGTIGSAFSLRDETVFSDLKKIKVPTLIMHGKLDKICSYGFATIMKDTIPHAVLDPFEYSGHGLFYDEMMKFNQDLLVFIEEN